MDLDWTKANFTLYVRQIEVKFYCVYGISEPYNFTSVMTGESQKVKLGIIYNQSASKSMTNCTRLGTQMTPHDHMKDMSGN